MSASEELQKSKKNFEKFGAFFAAQKCGATKPR
jgi:hypothetical protein